MSCYTCCAWAGGTFFPVVFLCQFLVLVGNRFCFYILMYLEYNKVWWCVSFLVLAGNSFWCYIRTQCTIPLCGCVSFLVVVGNRSQNENTVLSKNLIGLLFLLLHISFLYCQSWQKYKHRQSHFDFLNNAYWVSFFKRDNSLAKICFS